MIEPFDHARGRPARAGLWVLLALTVVAWAPTTYPGYWQALDGFAPLFNVVSSGPLATVATAADLWRGTGGGALMLARPFLLLGASPAAAVRFVFALCLLLGSLGVYSWLLPRYGDRAAALAGLLYAFFPATLATIYVRGSLGDAVVAAFIPLTLAATADYRRERSPATAAIALLAILWMWRSQAGLAFFASLLLLAYALWVERDPLGALVVFISSLAASISLIPLWSFQSMTPIAFHEHYVYLYQFFGNQWAVAPSVPGWQDAYPFQLGYAAILLSLLALWSRLFPPARPSPAADVKRLMAWAALAGAMLLFLTTAASRPLWELTGASRLLTYPWQLLGLLAPLMAALAASLLLQRPRLQQIPHWATLVLLVVLSSAAYTTSRFTQVSPPPAPVAVIGAHHNIALLAVDLRTVEEGAAAQLAVTWQVLAPLAADYNVFLQAVTEDDSGVAVVAQLDTPALPDGRPSSSWQAGEILSATYQLSLVKDTPEIDTPEIDTTTLRYLFGYYDWRDGGRLPVDGGIDDKLVLYAR